MKVELQFPGRRAPEPQERIPKLTALLVLGHCFEQTITRGLVKDYAAIGRLTGLSRARVTQIANLTLLSPAIQETILSADRTCRLTWIPERVFRSLLLHPDWEEQRRFLSKLRPGAAHSSDSPHAAGRPPLGGKTAR